MVAGLAREPAVSRAKQMGNGKIVDEISRWHQELRRTHSPAEVVSALVKRLHGENDPDTRRSLKLALAREHRLQGNASQLKLLFAKDRVSAVYFWYAALRRRGGDIVGAVEKRIGKETDPDVLKHLRKVLADEHTLRGYYASAEALLLQLHAGNDNEVFPLITLAHQKLYWENKPEAAMTIIDRAIACACRSGLFRRYVLGDKARFAVKLKQYAVVEDVLKQIMALTFEPANVDITVERDFFDRLPPGAISAEVAQQYETYCQARGKHKEPPAS